MKILTQRETFAYRIADLRLSALDRYAAAVAEELIDRLDTEFHDWWPDYAAATNKAADISSQGPIGNWANIESFLREKYPAAHRGFEMGQEEAKPLLDGEPNTLEQEYPEWFSQWRGKKDYSAIEPYATGPNAKKMYGYDPREIAAGMLLLHNRSHPFRSDLEQGDLDRLTQIVKIRHKQQQAYENRMQQTAMWHTAAAVSEGLISRINDEYENWWHHGGGRQQSGIDTGTLTLRGPIGHWPDVEKFLKERYPAAYRGFGSGMEGAKQMLDRPCIKTIYGETPDDDTKIVPYETGPEAEAKYGYDPREIASVLLLLHNRSHGLRSDLEDADIDRLAEIAQKRMKMQQAYEKGLQL